MIITCKKRVTFLWIVLATLPWVAVIFKDKVMGIAFTFSMRKFVENPAALSFLLTLPWYISWVVPPIVNFVADRIWTPWGRRKPFIVLSWIGTITSITLMPLAPDFTWLLAAYMAFCIFNDLGGPVESLKMEIVPPAQRATGAAVMSWIGQVAVLVFWVVAIGRFDEMNTIFGMPISGEQGLFWMVSLGMLVMLMFLTLGIKETNPHSELLNEKFSLRGVFNGLFSRHLWPVYILAFSVAVLGSGLGAFNQLLITEQWGYTKQDQGNNIAIGGIINLFLIPLLGLLANRVGRGKVYVGLVIAGMIVSFSMYMYYNFVLFDARPTLLEMVVFGEMLSVIGILTSMSLTPFLYDFIPRNELGTYAAGSGLVTRTTGIITANLMGVFVWGYATLFLGPPGEMVRVVLKDDMPRTDVQCILDSARWANPETGQTVTAPKLTAQAWYATGAKLDHGRGYEIRMLNANSSSIRDQRDRLEGERGKHKARRAYASNKHLRLTGRKPDVGDFAPSQEGPPNLDDPKSYADARIAAASALASTAGELAKRCKAATGASDDIARLAGTAEAERIAEEDLGAGIAQLDAILEKRANAFRAQTETVLAERLIREGEQILAASETPAALVVFPLKKRPDPGAVEYTLDRMRRADASLVDLRISPQDGATLTLTVCSLPDGARIDTVAARVHSNLKKLGHPEVLQSLASRDAPPSTRDVGAISMDLRIVEDPLDRHPSPITRFINWVWGLFGDPPTPERRLNALGRNLRRPGTVEYVGASLPKGDNNAVRLIAVATASTNGTADAQIPAHVSQRLSSLLKPELSPAAVSLYALALPAMKEQRMTVARPVVATSFAKQQYDFLAGYIAVFILQLVGLGITFSFLYMVKTGRVRRRGAEEAEAIQ
jgi:Na+/melibiose symporter-like transporter